MKCIKCGDSVIYTPIRLCNRCIENAARFLGKDEENFMASNLYGLENFKGDVFLNRKNGNIITNVPHVFVYHSEEFNWGYEGSGPAELAINILLLFTEPDFARRNYQGFKRDILSRIVVDEFVIPKNIIKNWLILNDAENIVEY